MFFNHQKISLSATLLLSSLINVDGQSRSPLPATHHKIIVIAHRGDHTEVPENTLAAYQKAIEHGADYIETDLRTTKDGALVIMHDATVNRMTNGTGNIKDLTLHDIKKLKIVSGNKQYDIPSFEEVLNTCKKKIGIYLDFKDADPEKVYSLIKQAGMDRHVVVYLNRDIQYEQWQKTAPQMPLMSSPPDSVNDAFSLQHFLQQKSISLMDGQLTDYTADMILTAKKNNVTIWLDVQSEKEGPADWNAALEKGITGLQTDHPEKLVQYLTDKGLR